MGGQKIDEGISMGDIPEGSGSLDDDLTAPGLPIGAQPSPDEWLERMPEDCGVHPGRMYPKR